MKCTICNEVLSLYEPYEILDGNRVHLNCYREEEE